MQGVMVSPVYCWRRMRTSWTSPLSLLIADAMYVTECLQSDNACWRRKEDTNTVNSQLNKQVLAHPQ